MESVIRVSKTLHILIGSYNQLMQYGIFIECNSSTQTYSTIGLKKKTTHTSILLCTLPVNVEKHLLLWHPNQWCPEYYGRSQLQL